MNTTKTLDTCEDLLAMPVGKGYELVDGKLVERHRALVSDEEQRMGVLGDLVAGRLYVLLEPFCDTHRLGWVLMLQSGGFRYAPRQLRKPDVAFVRFGRFPNEQVPSGDAVLAPDLAVEVVSPNDLHDEVERKIEDHLRAGVRLVWVISPPNRTVRVHRADGSGVSRRENDELDGEDVVPGFRCPVRDLFPPPPAPQQGDGNGTAEAPGSC
jgi:Uma2 family endonuclease